MGSIPTEPTGGVGAGEDRGAEVDLNWSAAQAETRLELRRWFESNLAAWRAEIGTERSGDTREGFEQQLLWEARLYDAGWSAVSWPRAFGGRDGTLWDWLIFEEEYWRAGAPQRVTQNGIQILAPSIFEHGTQAQKDHLLPRIAAANDLWCQGWSEPNAGSDLGGWCQMGLAGPVSGVGAWWRGTVLVVVGGAFGRRAGFEGFAGRGCRGWRRGSGGWGGVVVRRWPISGAGSAAPARRGAPG